MLQEISQEIKRTIINFPEEDKILFNNKTIPINKNNFQPIKPNQDKTLAFVDGGQAEIISAGNFSLSFIRIFAQLFKNNQKTTSIKNEFYLFTKAKEIEGKLYYSSKIFPLSEKLIEEQDLLIDSNDETIRNGTERAAINKITTIARRFAELAITKKINANYIILDGTLTPTFKNEEKYLSQLNQNICAIAKSSQLFTASGNSPNMLLNKIGPAGCWSYSIDNRTHLIKLHPQAKHVFRFEGNPNALPHLIQNSQDPLFLGYSYGLIFADKFARISHQEQSALKTKFLLSKENREILTYLTTTNAHDILDNIS